MLVSQVLQIFLNDSEHFEQPSEILMKQWFLGEVLVYWCQLKKIFSVKSPPPTVEAQNLTPPT